MYIKKNPTDKNPQAIISKEGVVEDAVNGIIKFTLVPSDTLNAIQLKENTHYTVDFVAILNNRHYNSGRTSFTLIID